jgi:peptidoglycan/xylan/chitin deacetylase (PgdA/CDA1 family)
MYPVKTPWLFRKIYPSFIWKMPGENKDLYLTFDDGPNETATPFVLSELRKYNAKATFFCIGKNVQEHPGIYKQVIDEGHKVGNHTQNHLNGWKTNDETYLQNIEEAAKYIDSNLFRPPYGRITKFQAKLLQSQIHDGESSINKFSFKIIMWSVLSGDFDTALSPAKCLENVLLNAESGAIILFHDSTKAFERMRYALPKTLEYFSERGFQFKTID